MPRKKTQNRSSNKSPLPTASGKPSQLRIISGEWGSRKIEFKAWDGLRPTPDRVRETLFNWLSFDIENRRCLDLFAGTGILGLEGLSRGAAEVTFVDSAKAACQQLKQNIAKLGVDNRHTIHQADVMRWLSNNAKHQTFNLVFADPPFRNAMIAPLIKLLESNYWLDANSLVYLEYEEELSLNCLPGNWHLLKQKKSGQVISVLLSRSANIDASNEPS